MTNTSWHAITPDPNATPQVGRIEFASSPYSTSVYTVSVSELVRTKQDARERITAALDDDPRFAHWKKKALAQLVDALVEALAQMDVSLT